MQEYPHREIPLVNTSNGPDNSNDHFRQIQIWLDLPTAREQRCFLELHRHLLDKQGEAILHALISQESGRSEQMQRLRDAHTVLQDAQRRGGTIEAVREAYVNLHGGFVLDIPSWLEPVEQRLNNLLKQNRPEETAEARVVLLREVLEQNISYTPELLITLQRELADAWRMHQHTDHAQAVETAINFCKEALLIFTVTHYPYQYAKTQHCLGRAYWERIMGERRENLEQAIVCYREALRIHTLESFPFDYASVQNTLGIVYWKRIEGERRENLEQAIVCYREALRVYTLESFPLYHARVQNNLGIAYWERIMGERRQNLEQAIVCYREALRTHTLDTFPFNYARVQNNLGLLYTDRIAGERWENLEQAIICYREALCIWKLKAFPYKYAEVQNNLGLAYRDRVMGKPEKNLEQAIACQYKALNVLTFDAFPFDYARVQNDLGHTYIQLVTKKPKEKLKQAITCYQEALRVYTVETFPNESRTVHMNLAEAEAQCENWNAVQKAYTAALKAEDLLVILGTGTHGRDAILKEGRDAAIRLGYALHRLGRLGEAAVAIERGRARGLAEAMSFDAADPTLITNEARRSHYTLARATLIATQAALHIPLSPDLDEDTRRNLDLERTTTYRQARATFDALITEIRAAHDPAAFLNDSLDATTILQAAEHIRPGHTLVYLAATPWGGVAVAAQSEQEASSARFTALDLPDLTEAFVNTLIEAHLQDSSELVIGGFKLAQMGEGFERLCQQWGGETFQAKARTLHAACHHTQQESTLNHAVQAAMACLPFAALAEQPLIQLDHQDQSLLETTFNFYFLQHELTHTLKQLSTTIMSPLVSWLQEQGATSLTLIPCGHLAAFPLPAVLLPDGRSVGETLPTSVAPSARSLLQPVTTRNPQAGMATLGDPHDNLPWSQAEALTLTALARRSQLPVEVRLKHQATRERLLVALGNRWVVNACCHATFDSQDFLQSALRLAKGEHVTMSEMLNHHTDLRGLRLFMLSACQTALLDLQGARDEVHSLAAAMVQAGAQAVLAAQWAVDDKATYLLMVRFAQEWLPQMEQESPAAALARAQAWLRHVTNKQLADWQSTMPAPSRMLPIPGSSRQSTTRSWQYIPVRGRRTRFQEDDAQLIVRIGAEINEPSAQPYADPYFWAGFQVIGW